MLAILLIVALGAPQEDARSGEGAPAPRAGAWRLIGPFRDRGAPDPRAVVGPQRHADEMQAGQPWPALESSFVGADDVPLGWMEPDVDAVVETGQRNAANPREVRGLDSGPLDVRALLPHLDAGDAWQRDVSVFLYRPIYASAAQTRHVSVGCDDGMRVWWNGRVVLHHGGSHAWDPLRHELELPVAEGLNHLLVKLTLEEGPWRFEMRERRAVSPARVQRAIDRGVENLLARQLADGSWRGHGQYRNGTTALAAYTLLKSGVPARHPAVLQAMEWLALEPASGTYDLALQIMATAAFDDPAHDESLREMTARLVDWQLTSGLWGYPAGRGDLSNTQYAALGLRAAASRGVEIPHSTWRRLRTAVLSCGTRSGVSSGSRGFSYRSGDGRYTVSMTAAGIGTLAICQPHLGGGGRAERAIEEGLDWLARRCPLHARIEPSTWSYYMLYGLERAGGLTGREHFGEHAWYREGAHVLVEQQADDGSWRGSNADVTTCFALLFLRRATSRVAVTQQEIGGEDRLLRTDAADGELTLRGALHREATFWVDATSPRFDEIERVIYWIQAPGESWRPIAADGERRRFTIRHALDRPGIWHVRASAFLSDGSTVGSGVLRVEREEGLSPALRDAVTAATRNLLTAAHPSVETSSRGPAGHARALIDGRYETRWLCAADDREPWIRLRLQRSAQASRLMLAPAVRERDDPWPLPQARLARVLVNGEHVFLARVREDGRHKAEVDFGEELRVRSLEIEILGTDGGALGETSVGFAEIELF